MDNKSQEKIITEKKSMPLVVFATDEREIITPKQVDATEAIQQPAYSVFSHDKFTKEFMEHNVIIKIRGILYLYISEKGYFHSITGGLSDTPIRMQMPEHLKGRCTSSVNGELIKWLDAWIQEYPGIVDPVYCLNFKNGYFNIATNTFHAHTPDMVFTYTLNSDYMMDIKDTPTFDEFLNNICGNQPDLCALLSQHFGYIISSVRSLKIFTVLYGPTNTGKSAWIDLMNMAIGEEFSTAIPLQNIGQDFRTSGLLGSRLNSFTEIDDFRKQDAHMLKALTSGGDRVNCNVKYGSTIDLRNLAALVFASNTLENFKMFGQRDAIYERLLIIPFLNQIDQDKRIYNLREKLQEELPYIIKKFAIPGLYQLYLNNCEFTDTELISSLKVSLLRSENSVYKFLSDYCEFGEDLRVSSEELYQYYRKYCSKNQIEAKTKTEFTEIMKIADTYFQLDFPFIKKRVRIPEEGNVQGYVGLKLK